MRSRFSPKIVLQAIILIAALVACALALADQWPSISSRLHRIGPDPVVGALALAGVANISAMMSWRAILVDLGSPLPRRAAARIFFLSSIGKYLPGSVWPYMAQMEMGRKYDIPRPRSAAASILAVLVSLTIGLLIAAATIPWTSASAMRTYWPVFLAVPVLLAALHPAVIERLVGFALRVLKRPPLDQRVSWSGLAVSSAWTVLTWVAYGFQVWILCDAVAKLGPRAPIECIGAYALAWCAGFLVVIAPAGAGIREVALTASLSAIMPAPAALTVALVSRAVTTVGDFGAAAVGAFLGVGRNATRPAVEVPAQPKVGPPA